MSNHGRKNSQEPQLSHLDSKTAGAVSATDVTGLMPAKPRPEDVEEYEDILGLGEDTTYSMPKEKH